MKRLLLLCAGLPFLVKAQEVKPVLSADYLALIQHDSTSKIKTLLSDSTNNLRRSSLFIRMPYRYGYPISDIRILNNEVVLQQLKTRRIEYSTSASITAEWQQHNRQAATQHVFVQGRFDAGQLIWRGPETGEPFSFGPSIYTLQYDGSAYPYDINGRLVPITNGNDGIARSASPYNNSILRGGSMLNSTVTLMARYKINGNPVFSTMLRAGQVREQTIIPSQKNKTGNFYLQTEGTLKKVSVSSSYTYREQKSNHSNRDGFLNRVYQNSLLTPVSFSNHQNSHQTSHQPYADNPWFLLGDKGHDFLLQQQTGSLFLQRTFNNKLKTKIIHSIDQLKQLSKEGYQAGTAFFPSGISVQRAAKDQVYRLNVNAEYKLNTNSYGNNTLTLNYIYTSGRSAIRYNIAHTDYRYVRNSHDLSLSYAPEFDKNGKDGGIILVNKLYFSSTSNQPAFILPSVSGYIRFFELFGLRRSRLKLYGSYNRFNSELPLNNSFAGSNLLQYTMADAGRFISTAETDHFNNLNPIRQQELMGGFEFAFNQNLTLYTNCFSRKIKDDVFPVYTAGRLMPVNIADHRTNGIEINLQYWLYKWNPVRFTADNTISFMLSRSKVLKVKDGYNHMPLAGFSNVHKTLVQGEPLGVISGNTWQRNSNGALIIGADGFPLVNNTISVIGDPTPDFTMKMNNHISYKDKWDLSIDWEWKKGGDMWNGTQAMLDYYGRSAASAALRSTAGYVFNGVQANGAVNTIPVSFYDASQPAESNRWVRYGPGGVAEEYIQRSGCFRLQNIYLSYSPIQNWYGNTKKIQRLTFSLYATNLVIWSAYKGADPNQQLFDQPGTSGLDFFNLPSVHSFGFSTTLQL